MNTNLIIVLFCALVVLVSFFVIVWTIISLMKVTRREKQERQHFRDNFGKF